MQGPHHSGSTWKYFAYGDKGSYGSTRENLEDIFIIGKKGIMRKEVILIILAIIAFEFVSGLYNDVAATQEEDQAFKTIDRALDKAEASTNEFTQVMQEEPCDIKKAEAVLADMLTTADTIMDDCKKFCSDRSLYDAYTCMYCRKASVAIVSDSAKQMLAVAQYYAKVGNKDKAKVMYRKVIATFVGDAYRSYVLEAEFWLEDLK